MDTTSTLTLSQARTLRQLEEALKVTGTHTLLDVVNAIKRNEAVFFQRHDTIVVAEIRTFPQKTVLHFWVAAGDLGEVEALMPEIETWGRKQGATMAEAIGRAGWMKAAKKHGYKPQAALYLKDLRQ